MKYQDEFRKEYFEKLKKEGYELNGQIFVQTEKDIYIEWLETKFQNKSSNSDYAVAVKKPTHAKPTQGDCMLLDRLPNHLHLARNSNAPEFDRWRLYSTVTHECFEKFSGATPDEVMQKYIEWEDADRKAWVGE